ncbi:polar amino acid transport system substrate-binding protein [Deinococcus hopiensis KR-140]|uniref:Polar amino acid transport system substrate-binding protein n=2 Tax=Deinococcus TaxID=1298 RepID=A0A1W1VWX7_9DEIO|nr:polar amino acid transport system substrate-binding protein [Deinococcus hopiensis KR-140]
MQLPKIATSAVVLLVMFLASSVEGRELSQIQSAGKIKIGSSTTSPGFLYKNGTVRAGFAVDLVNILSSQMKIKKVDWLEASTTDALFKGIDSGSFDVILDAKLPPPRYNVNISVSVACTGGVILGRPGGPTKEAQLRGKRIAVAEKTQYAAYARNLPFQKNVVVFDTPDQALLAFLNGSVDVLVLDRLEALTMYKRVGPTKLQVSPVLWNEEIHFVMPHTSDAFRDAIDAALAKTMANGSYANLSKKYFSEDIRCSDG